VAIDVGTGDGRAVLAAAADEPRRLVIGLDADARSMADASRRAARASRKGGISNALFVVAAAASMPVELTGVATLVTITFPWGSLLRGCVGLDGDVAGGIRGLLGAAGRFELILAPADRDRLEGVPTDPTAVVGATRKTFETLGLGFVEGRPATAEELRGSNSSWARRLIREGRGRQAILIRFASP
jgi:16S rRNA (adenine(1408)-N(1))-methyltransferase